MEKLCKVLCSSGYFVLGEKSAKLYPNNIYRIVGKSIHYPHCYVIELPDNQAANNLRWIVPYKAVVLIE